MERTSSVDGRGLSSKLLTTKQLPEITGLSQSYFEKGRIYGYGPRFIRLKSGRGSGRVLYRLSEVERWLCEHEQGPEGAGDE